MASGITSEIGGGVDLRAMRRLARGDDFLVGHVGGLMHPTEKGQTPVENSLIAKWLHDGTAAIVARPYLLQGIRDGWVRIQKAMRLYLRMKIENPAQANPARVGAEAVGAVQEFVRGGYYKSHLPNAPSTIKRKGSDTPLIDKGFLINSVTFVARPGEDPKGWPTSNAVEAKD